MILSVTELSNIPIHDQILQQLLDRILSGAYAAGRGLPRARALAREHRVNVGSVRRAYKTLEHHEVVERDCNDGLIVAELTDEKLFAIEEAEGICGRESNEQRISRELAMAQDIQKRLFATSLPQDEFVSITASATPSSEVGGDFYDVIPIDPNRLAIVIADASGKGLSAAMMIAQLHALIRSEAANGNSIPTILQRANERLIEFTTAERFVTLFYGVYDKNSGVLEYSNAGHNHPMVVRQDGSIEELETGGPVLGVLPEVKFCTAQVVLGSNDFVFFYTDGITETSDVRSEQYGEERLAKLLRRIRFVDTDAIVERVLDDVDDFSSNAKQRDDRTIVVLRSRDVQTRMFP